MKLAEKTHKEIAETDVVIQIIIKRYSKDPCIDINQPAVLLSFKLTTGGNVKQNYTDNALWGAQQNRQQWPIRDLFELLELYSSLKSNLNYKRGNVEWILRVSKQKQDRLKSS